MIAKFKRTKKGSWQNIFFSVFLGILILTVVGFLIGSNIRMNKKRAELNSRITELKEEIQALEEKNEVLKTGISRIEEESYWEEKIREQGYKKPGEEAVVVLPLEEKKETESGEGFWKKFLEKLKFW